MAPPCGGSTHRSRVVDPDGPPPCLAHRAAGFGLPPMTALPRGPGPPSRCPGASSPWSRLAGAPRGEARWPLADWDHTSACRPSAAGADVPQRSALAAGRPHAPRPRRSRPIVQRAHIPLRAQGASACPGGPDHVGAALHHTSAAVGHGARPPPRAARAARAPPRPSAATPRQSLAGKRPHVPARAGGWHRASVDPERPRGG